jgi:broad specificity phosphatase PhoE
MKHRFQLQSVLSAWCLSVLVAVAAFAAPASDPCNAPGTTIVIVRHADRAGSADSLSAAGVERARDLSRALTTASITRIYHSDTHRTRDTAAPLAAALGLEPREYPAKEAAALMKNILRDDAGRTVLVVGHSNTVPLLIASAGGPKLADIDEKEFDGLFIVTVPPCAERPVTLTQLQYGAPSP